MRIVAGSHRGRRLRAPAGGTVRPTADRVRETLFNMLAHGRAAPAAGLAGARVLDAFAGSGALGLEALSRGAAHASFMETSAEALEVLRANIHSLALDAVTTILTADLRDPPKALDSCQLVLMDPPYGAALAAPALAALAEAGWMAPGALCAVELAAREPFTSPPGFAPLDDRRVGAARLVFFKFRCEGAN